MQVKVYQSNLRCKMFLFTSENITRYTLISNIILLKFFLLEHLQLSKNVKSWKLKTFPQLRRQGMRDLKLFFWSNNKIWGMAQHDRLRCSPYIDCGSEALMSQVFLSHFRNLKWNGYYNNSKIKNIQRIQENILIKQQKSVKLSSYSFIKKYPFTYHQLLVDLGSMGNHEGTIVLIYFFLLKCPLREKRPCLVSSFLW